MSHIINIINLLDYPFIEALHSYCVKSSSLITISYNITKSQYFVVRSAIFIHSMLLKIAELSFLAPGFRIMTNSMTEKSILVLKRYNVFIIAFMCMKRFHVVVRSVLLQLHASQCKN